MDSSTPHNPARMTGAAGDDVTGGVIEGSRLTQTQIGVGVGEAGRLDEWSGQ